MDLKVVFLVFVVCCQLYIADASISNQCLRCICNVESNCDPKVGCGDGGRSCGPYQIMRNYWIEGGSNGYAWKSCVRTSSCAKNTIRGYMRRYATSARLGHYPTCEDYARIHNGGPNGYRWSSTLGYWRRIQAQGCSANS